MGRPKATLLALVAALLAATALSACGGSDSADLLPGETARDINANLDLVETLVAEGDCVGASNAAAAVSEQVEALGGVDQKLKEALAKGAARLNEKVVTECDEAGEEETTSSAELENEEREEEERAKEEEKAQKEAEKELKKEEKEEKEVPPAEPPGQEKKDEEKAEAPPSEGPTDGGTPSGGVSPGTEVGGE